MINYSCICLKRVVPMRPVFVKCLDGLLMNGKQSCSEIINNCVNRLVILGLDFMHAYGCCYCCLIFHIFIFKCGLMVALPIASITFLLPIGLAPFLLLSVSKFIYLILLTHAFSNFDLGISYAFFTFNDFLLFFTCTMESAANYLFRSCKM
jgi:hypothetical protein